MLRLHVLIVLTMWSPRVVFSIGLPDTEAPKALEEHVRRIAEAMVGYLRARM